MHFNRVPTIPHKGPVRAALPKGRNHGGVHEAHEAGPQGPYPAGRRPLGLLVANRPTILMMYRKCWKIAHLKAGSTRLLACLKDIFRL